MNKPNFIACVFGGVLGGMAAWIVVTAINNDMNERMSTCQLTYSHDTCFSALNR